MHTYATYSVILWVPYVSTLSVLDDHTATPLTDKSRRKLQSTENFIDAIKTVQIPGDYKLVSFDVKSLFTSIPLQLALQCTETAIQQSTTVTDRRHHGLTEPLPYIDLLSVQR